MLTRTKKQIVLTDDTVVRLEGVPAQAFVGQNKSKTQRFVEVVDGDSHGTYIRRSTRLVVGRVTIGEFEIVVAPPFAPELFVLFVLYSLKVDLTRYANRPTSSLVLGNRRGDVFLSLMAALLVAEAEQLLRGHIAKGYIRRSVRSVTLRGSVNWSRTFGRHPADGWECLVYEQLTDEPLNRLVLAGLIAAADLLEGTTSAVAAATQLFIWRQLAQQTAPTPAQFEVASRRVTRLTDSYIPALALARALTLGTAPADLISPGDTKLHDIEFSVPNLFETFLVRLLTPCAQRLGLRLEFKQGDTRALVDGWGEPYRRVEPDVVVYRGNTPVGVIDAKFKPRYVKADPLSPEQPQGRVTNEDIYQLFFYQSRLQSLAGMTSPPRAMIVAPAIESMFTPSSAKRTIVWDDQASEMRMRPSLRVLPLPLAGVLEELQIHSEVEVVAKHMPEIMAELRTMAAQEA